MKLGSACSLLPPDKVERTEKLLISCLTKDTQRLKTLWQFNPVIFPIHPLSNPLKHQKNLKAHSQVWDNFWQLKPL